MSNVIKIKELNQQYYLEATYREPFEYFFEIATHNARFLSLADAIKLKARVDKAIHENGWKSLSYVIGREHWSYTSSAYETKLGSTGKVYTVGYSESSKI